MVALYETLRPKTLEDFVGFREVIDRLVRLHSKIGWDGQVFWISGFSGTGKTTLARIIASTISCDLDIEEVDAQDVSIDLLRDWEKRCHYSPMAGFKAHSFIINEAHTLSSRVVSRLQTLLETEAAQKRGTFLFTTTERGQQMLLDTKFDAFPFLSRAIKVKLEMSEATIVSIAQMLEHTGAELGLEYPFQAYADALVDCKGNVREVLQRIASGSLV
jgi:replication-associated recombination protein RarA